MNAFFDAQFEIVGPDRIQVFFDLELLWAFLVTWILGTLLLAVRLRLINAGALMFLKLIIVFVFFIFFYQPEWKTGGDDEEYFRSRPNKNPRATSHGVSQNRGRGPRLVLLFHLSYVLLPGAPLLLSYPWECALICFVSITPC